MKVVGLTGGVGMGKSACSELLRQRGAPVVDTDELARLVVRPGQPALTEITQVFGAALVDQHGELRRSEMARLVFSNPEARAKLEQILHPRIRLLWREQVETWRAAGHPLGIVVIPLLFETNAEQELQATICVGCSARTQMSRLKPRGWSVEQIQQRISAQLSIEEKIARSTFVIWNEAGLDILGAQTNRIVASLHSPGA